MRSLHRITFSRNRFDPRSARADLRADLGRPVATRNQPMIFFGTISLSAWDETSTPTIQRVLHRYLISAAPNLLNVALSCRGFRSLRLALD